ncbi:MAG: M14 family zinc carboxypeptidase, partial [Myxococcota bacterium]
DYASSVFADQRGPNIEDAAPIDAQGLYIDIHSFSELILWPWGFSGEAPNGGGLRRLGEKISYFNGYAPSQAVELYPTDGTTVDFVYGELGVASIVFELGTQFFQSCEVFEQQILPDNLQALVYAAKTAAAPYLVPGGPDLSEVSWNGSSLTAFASSERRGSGLPIARVEASWSLPPIGASAPDGFELDPMDGAFDSSEEEVGLALTTVQPGRRLLYLRAQDGEGRFGAPSAVFVDGGGPTGSLDGQVTSASDGTPLTAMLSVEELGLRVSTDGTGAFQMALPEGTWTVTVSIGGMSRAYPALEILEGQTTLMNFVF